MTKKQMLKKIPLYLIAVIFIIFNYTSFYYAIDLMSKEVLLIVPLVITFPIFLYILVFNKTIDYRSMALAIVLISNAMLSSIIRNDISAEVYMLITAIFIAFVVSNILEKQQFVDCYVNLMLFFAVCSLITTYIIMPLDVEDGFGIIPIVIRGEQSYFNMLTTICIRMYGIARNCGFCREPGVYQIFILFALFFVIEHQEKSKYNIIKAIFFIIVLLSTFSAVCYIIAPICIVLLMKKYIKNMRTFVKTVLITVICLVIFVIIIGSNQDIIKVFTRTIMKWDSGNESDSMFVRTAGVIYNLTLFFEKPLFGHGLMNSWHEVMLRSSFKDVTGTSFIGFAAFGVVFGSVLHYIMFKACKSKSMLSTFVWFFSILLSTLSQNIIISNLFWIFMFFSFMKDDKPEKSEANDIEPLAEQQADENEEQDEEEPQKEDILEEIPDNLKLNCFLEGNKNESN